MITCTYRLLTTLNINQYSQSMPNNNAKSGQNFIDLRLALLMLFRRVPIVLNEMEPKKIKGYLYLYNESHCI